MSALTAILACPRCATSLERFRCPACQLDYPVHADVPWLFADPEAVRTEWRNRWHMALAELEARAGRVSEALQRAERVSSRNRLETLHSGYQQQTRLVRALLSSLELGTPADLSTYLALKTRLPPTAGLFSYDANVFRDWNWGKAENDAACQAALEVLGDFRPERTLVLGAGAGRLAYDLHQHWQRNPKSGFPEVHTVALDMNPYLISVARRVTIGESLQLVEFPRAPSDASATAICRTLAAPEPVAGAFDLILADALRPPFQVHSFDLVITPWLIDVVDVDPAEFIRRLNPLLKSQGQWLLQGSLAFDRADPLQQPDLAELAEIAADTGFEKIRSIENRVPYLDCPDSRHARMETVVTMAAEKISDAGEMPKYQTLPDWLARGREPIPLLPAFQTQAMTTRMHAFIMTLIDGKRSLKDIATVLEEQQLMPKADAEVALRGFLIRMFEEALQQRH